MFGNGVGIGMCNYDAQNNIDPQGVLSGSRRVVRGGGWNLYAKELSRRQPQLQPPLLPHQRSGCSFPQDSVAV